MKIICENCGKESTLKKENIFFVITEEVINISFDCPECGETHIGEFHRDCFGINEEE